MPVANYEIINAVIAFADQSHGRQMRRYTPERYIVHPVRVMNMCAAYTGDITMLAAAILHDVVEDTPVTAEDVAFFLEDLMPVDAVKNTVRLVDELTDVYTHDNYPNWNRKKRKAKEIERMAQISPGAQTIKYADIIDNASEIVTADPDFAQVFVYECASVLKNIDKGDPVLYQEALNIIAGCISKLKHAPRS